ncbi:MAG TPA: PQQ-dependent sugar dehydrogenase [Solirubrobacteraceae bacterium]|nr:PQQ-dependent sugar dehydrogenase [Solirubrobacteraceae bacterium]
MARRLTARLFLFAAVAALALPASACAGSGSSLRLARVGSFDQPVHVTAPPGDARRLFVVEQAGRIRVVRDGRTLPGAFLDISGRVACCGERGLFSMAFAPDYARSGRFYVSYTDRAGNSRIEEFRRVSADRARAGSRRLVLFQDQPEPNHNGGLIVFGPDDLLYVGFGDGGGGGDMHGARGNAQNLNTLLGKILRIDPRASGRRRYRVPRDNPFVGRAGRDEVWAYGLRNPWRFSFDRANGDLIVGDVGQNSFEEVTWTARGAARGRNYGWRVWEGRRRNTSEPAGRLLFPQITYPTRNGCAVTGGYVVRDPALRGWQGRYLYADYCNGSILTARLGRGGATDSGSTGLRVSELASFGEDSGGRVYVVSRGGPVHRIVAR